MKKLIILTSLTLLLVEAFTQANFKWEKVDSVAKTKAQIYSDTKMFIAQTWQPAYSVQDKGAIATQVLFGFGEIYKNIADEKHSIQNDDKENGSILVKGEIELRSTFMMNVHVYKYSYTATFMMKENKCRIVLDNVHCIYAHCAAYDWPLIEPCDEGTCGGYGETGVPQGKLTEMMASLKAQLQNIVDSYGKYVQLPSAASSDW